ncbi:MAG: YqiA/YcfP family alpha/beta fold hydrolase [Bryobacteraceae bacterium]
MNAIYLHGFASGSGSKKGRYFAERFAAHGILLHTPDLVPDFESITLSGQLGVVEAVGAGRPIDLLIGSSMGGYLAALYAARRPKQVRRVVCLAPAFDFANRWALRQGEEGMALWRETGKLPVFHYGIGREARVGYELYTDSQRFEPFPAVANPILIAHGLRDDVVPIDLSREFARRTLHAELREFDSDHELIDVLPKLWEAVWAFSQS